MTAEQVEKTMALITPTTSYDGFDQVDIVVEAVFENMDLKKATFAELGKVTRPDCVLASNSSTLDIDRVRARRAGAPAQVLGHHFFSPANVMKLLEIVRGRETSKEVIATSLKLAKKLGKVGVVVGNCFGFVANRMLAYYMREAYLLLEEGASVEQIDTRAHRVRPAGRSVRHAGHRRHRRRRAHPAVPRRRSASRARKGPQSEIPDRLFEMGRYGQKTGAGWYKYDAPGSRNRTPDPLIDQLAEEEAKKRGIARRPVVGRGDRRAHHDGARQRRGAGARRRLRDARRRHRHHLCLRLRLPAPPRRADVLRGHRRPADRAGARARNIARGSATTGSRRRCSSGWRPKAAGFTASRLQPRRKTSNRRASQSTARIFALRSSRAQRLNVSMIEITDVRSLRDRIGQEIAVSDWLEVTQARIDQFAEATGDHQWIHVDPARAAAESPFKTTIAHGFLTLSLLSRSCATR